MDAKNQKILTAYVMPKTSTTKTAQYPTQMGPFREAVPMQPGMPMMDPMMMQQMAAMGQTPGVVQQPHEFQGQQAMGMDPMMAQQMDVNSMMQQGQMPGGMQPGQPGMMPGPDGSMPQQMQEQTPMQPGMDPSMMMGQGAEMAQGLNEDELFDTSALTSLSYISELETLFPKYLPNLIKSLDSVARIIINFWINSDKLQEDIGVTEYTNIENKLKTLYENLSDLLLTLNKKIDIFSHK
jgi:hypothetical protein